MLALSTREQSLMRAGSGIERDSVDIHNSKRVLEQSRGGHHHKRQKVTNSTAVSTHFANPCSRDVLMGNITKRGSKEPVADTATPQDDTSVTTLHSRLYGAIIKEDCNTIKKLLRTHPVNQPLNILVNPTSCRLLLNQVLPLSGILKQQSWKWW